MQHHKVSVGDDRSVFIPERRRDALDETEETLPAGPDMRAVLDIVRRPKPLRRVIITVCWNNVLNASKTSRLFFSLVSSI
jgi:hypothetical protein